MRSLTKLCTGASIVAAALTIAIPERAQSAAVARRS